MPHIVFTAGVSLAVKSASCVSWPSGLIPAGARVARYGVCVLANAGLQLPNAKKSCNYSALANNQAAAPISMC